MTDAGTALDRLLEATLLLDADMRRGLGALGLTGTSAHLLVLLGRGGPSTQRDLATGLDVAPRTVTTLVDDLAARGLVTREPHPRDRRATLVTPTDDGAALLERLERERVELAALLFGPLDDDAVAAFTGALDDVLDRLRTAVAEAAS